MSLDIQSKKFYDKYMQDTDNVFEAINQFSKDANKLRKKHKNLLACNEALSATLSGILPSNLEERKTLKHLKNKYLQRYVSSVLADVDDIEVKLSVLQSINQSQLSNSLEYEYLDSLTSNQQARVRILTRLIWFNIHLEVGDQMEELETEVIETPKRRRGRPKKSQETKSIEVESTDNTLESSKNVDSDESESKITIEDLHEKSEESEEETHPKISIKEILEECNKVEPESSNLIIITNETPLYKNPQCTQIACPFKGSAVILDENSHHVKISGVVPGIGRITGYLKK